jgi:hypothetical protein
MAQDEGNVNLHRSTGLIWAFFSPLLVVAGFIVFPFLPAICVFLDGKSRTYTSAATVLIVCVALPFVFGVHLIAVSAFFAITTAAAYVFTRIKIGFASGLMLSAVCGIFGSVVLLGLLGASYDKPLNEVAASILYAGLADTAVAGYPAFLNVVAGIFKGMETGQLPNMFWYLSPGSYSQLVSGLSVAAQLDIIRPVLEQLCAVYIPAYALVGGLFTGALGYYLPKRALGVFRRKISAQPGIEQDQSTPRFSAFKIPKYIFISLFLLQLLSSVIATGEDLGIMALSIAAEQLFNSLMIIQALAMISYFLGKKRIQAPVQILIMIPTVLVFSNLVIWAGIFDALFDFRSVVQRMDAVRAKGKQVFTQEGLEELRKMEQRRKDEKDDKDGKEGGAT